MLPRQLRKVLKDIGSSLPFNKLRVVLLKLSGHRVGKSVWIGKGLLIIDDCSLKERVVIGNRVAFAPRVTLVLQSFPNFSMIKGIAPTRCADITIDDDAWIGTGSIILPGVKIGKGSVIGAGSIVTKDVPPWSVVAGNPARVIRNLGMKDIETEGNESHKLPSKI